MQLISFKRHRIRPDTIRLAVFNRSQAITVRQRIAGCRQLCHDRKGVAAAVPVFVAQFPLRNYGA